MSSPPPRLQSPVESKYLLSLEFPSICSVSNATAKRPPQSFPPRHELSQVLFHTRLPSFSNLSKTRVRPSSRHIMTLPVSMEDTELFPKSPRLDPRQGSTPLEIGIIRQMRGTLSRLWWSRLVISVRGYVINYVQVGLPPTK